MMERAQIEQYVGARLAYARHHGITNADCVAQLAFTECDAMADFPGGHGQGWWREILEDDVPQEFKLMRLAGAVERIEANPHFVPDGGTDA